MTSKRVACWRQEQVQTSAGSFLASELGATIGCGIVESPSSHPLWLPYVEVDDIRQATARRLLGAQVLPARREGPVGGAA